jgi:hypothetical protein
MQPKKAEAGIIRSRITSSISFSFFNPYAKALDHCTYAALGNYQPLSDGYFALPFRTHNVTGIQGRCLMRNPNLKPRRTH